MNYHAITNKIEGEEATWHVSGPSISNYSSQTFSKEQAEQVAVWLNGAYINGNRKAKEKIARALGLPGGLAQ